MKEFKLFYLETCPYCLKARQYMEELRNENPEYQRIGIRNDRRRTSQNQPIRLTITMFPTFYLGDEKLHEGAMTKEDVQSVFDKVLQRHR